ncbi:aspartic peptidase A1 [Pholiota molesta]|nr:aspartic peptidase A1 [Pholiota molesta]
MQLGLSLSALLSCVLLMLTTQVVEAGPLSRRSPNFVTLPLKRVELARGLHPRSCVYLQQHINRGERRLARMTGRAGPTHETLVENLERRVLAIEGPEGLEKRFNRMGVPRRSTADNVLEKRYNRIGVPHKAKTTGAASLASLKSGKNRNGAKGSKSSQPAAAPAAPASSVTNANTPTTANSLGLDIEAQDVGYLATVQMGTPPRDFLILMDSGSADFWVGSESCQSLGGGGCGNHNFLGTQSSSTFVDSGSPFSVTYGTGSVAGDIITDNVSLAGLALNNHTFGVATRKTLSEQQTDTPVESLAKAGLIPDAITSFKISRLSDNKNDGEITFGALDTTKFDPNTLVSIPNVNAQGFWEGALDAVSVDGTDLGLSGRTAILDTGTTLMVVPANDAATIHNSIPGAASDGQGGFTVPCTTTASVALTFGGQAFAIDPRDIAFQPVDANNPQGDCTSGITAGSIGGANEWLVGDVFLKNAYFSTDEGKNTVSLAKLV